MAMRGERFELNLDPEDAYLDSQDAAKPQAQPKGSLGFDFVKDVLERAPAAATPPQPPKLKPTASGFPEHKKRGAQSRFKQKRAGVDGEVTKSKGPSAPSDNAPASSRYLSTISNASLQEKKSIDQQNTQMIENMSPEELEEARRELLSEPSVNILRRLLQRSTIDETDGHAATHSTDPVPQEPPPADPLPAAREHSHTAVPAPKKSVSFARSPPSSPPAAKNTIPRFDEDAPPPVPPSDLQDVTSTLPLSDPTNLLAPKQGSSQPHPTLDPSSTSFLSDLHSTYFPDLPTDPNQLAWMTPVPDADTKPRNTTHTPASDLRFSFRGTIITAQDSASIPVTKGLHHHGRDPGAAGYTINELAIYARSTVPAQRCFAYQLLGRILFRLGQGEFGDEESQSPQGQTARGLYDEFKKGYVLDQLLKEAAREPGTGNESARVWALEAVWLWRKGGGKGLDDVEVEEGFQEDDVMGEAAGAILEEGLN